MKLEKITKKVQEVRDLAGTDFEAAHGREIDLHKDVLRAIANGKCEDPAACAKEALRTTRIKFKRVTA